MQSATTRRFKFGVLLSLFLLIAGLTLTGLGQASAQTGQGRVRVAHMSPDAPAVDVYVDGTRALQNVPFKTVSDYLPLPSGSHKFEVRPAGASATSAAVISADATIAASKDYTVAATGLLANIKATVYEDDNSPAPSGQSKVRVYHNSPDAPAVDVAPKDAAPVISNLAFPNASSYLNLPANTYNLEVRAAGTSTVALALPNVAIPANKIVSVFAANKLANLEVVVAAANPVSAATLPTAPSSGAGGTASTNSFSFGLVALAVLTLLAVTAGATRFARRKN